MGENSNWRKWTKPKNYLKLLGFQLKKILPFSPFQKFILKPLKFTLKTVPTTSQNNPSSLNVRYHN